MGRSCLTAWFLPKRSKIFRNSCSICSRTGRAILWWICALKGQREPTSSKVSARKCRNLNSQASQTMRNCGTTWSNWSSTNRRRSSATSFSISIDGTTSTSTLCSILQRKLSTPQWNSWSCRRAVPRSHPHKTFEDPLSQDCSKKNSTIFHGMWIDMMECHNGWTGCIE